METTKKLVPRLCVLQNDGSGYGFNLECERGKFGQYVRNIRAGSPAERGGLRSHDRVVEVNGKNVEDCTHQQVVAQIKESDVGVSLLVIDPEADAYFTRRGMRVSAASLNRHIDADIEVNKVEGSDSIQSQSGAEKSPDGSLNEFADASINNLNVASSSQQNASENGHANVSQTDQPSVNEDVSSRRADAIVESGVPANANKHQNKLDEPDNSAIQNASIDQVRARMNMKRGEKIAVKQSSMSFQQKSAVFDSL